MHLGKKGKNSQYYNKYLFEKKKENKTVVFKLLNCGIFHGANHFKITHQHIETSAINPVYYPQCLH